MMTWIIFVYKIKKINNNNFTSLSIALQIIFAFAFPHTIRQQCYACIQVQSGKRKLKTKRKTIAHVKLWYIYLTLLSFWMILEARAAQGLYFWSRDSCFWTSDVVPSAWYRSVAGPISTHDNTKPWEHWLQSPTCCRGIEQQKTARGCVWDRSPAVFG